MDRVQEDLKFLGCFGILKESFKIIFKWKKIFTQITLALILPLSILFLAKTQISDILFKTTNKQATLEDDTPVGTYNHNKGSNQISTQWTVYNWLFKALLFTSILIISLFATSAVAYTISCFYTAKEITFKKVMSVVPKVWKRLLVTFLLTYLIALVYNVVAVILLVLPIAFIGFKPLGIVLFVVLLILYLAGLIYMTIAWSLASVVSVLEDVGGIKAMNKSRALIKGKIGAALAILILLTICFAGISFTFENIVVIGNGSGVGIRIGIGIVCLLLLFPLTLIGLVIQTVMYFVCKSYHHENVDLSYLKDQLEV